MKIIRIVVIVAVFAFGILLGFTVKNFPVIQWNKEIKIYEAFQVLTTLFIALVIPFFIKRWIDDSRVVKSLLKEEANDISDEVKKINKIFQECFKNGFIDSADKKSINMTFSQLDNLIEIFEKSITVAFGNRCNVQFQDFKIAYLEYWKNITSGDLMANSFSVVNEDFYYFHSVEYSKFLQALREFNIFLQRK